MFNHLRKRFLFLFSLILLLGCAAGESAESTIEPLPTRTLLPTATPQPTATPRPTATPEPTPEPTEEVKEPVANTTFAQWVVDDTHAEGAESTLIRMPHGIYATFNAVDLEPGDAYTMWWIIFNKPENCTDSECGLDDGFLMDENGEMLLVDYEPQFNMPQRAAIEMSVHRAAGSIVDADGTAEFRAHLAVGDTTEAYFNGPGLIDPFWAEAHVMLRSHGQMIPGQIHDQMNTPWGGCPEGWPKDPCRNIMFAVHLAPK